MTKKENIVGLSSGEAKQYIEETHNAMANIEIAGTPISADTTPLPLPEIKMTVKTISTTYERKFNLGEYESASLGVTTWADIEPEQDPTTAINELAELCKAQVRKQALPILRGRKNGGFEFAELQDKYTQLAALLDEALNELTLQEPHEDEYKSLVERLNVLTKGE